jgi:hypothetical protein
MTDNAAADAERRPGGAPSVKPRLDVPVVLVAFRRADTLARVLGAVRTARPRLLFVVTDAPRAAHPGDAAGCAAVRDVLGTIDWPCDIRRLDADRNLGCDVRIATGLDWVFRQVDEAIVLEDDVVPDASFFPWCAAMLRRHRRDRDVMHVSGRNELGRWGAPDADHLFAWYGSIWGWATWARAWFGVDRTSAADPACVARTRAALDALAMDPLLSEHLRLQLNAAAAGRLATWDGIWGLSRIRAGGLSVIPPINLTVNIGFGAHATHTTNDGDLRRALGYGVMRATGETPVARPFKPDPTYDRWSLLLGLMATYRQPDVARRLAGSLQHLPARWPGEREALLHHLTPFAHAEEAIDLLQHLRAFGAATLESAMIEAALHATVASREAALHA